MRGQAIRYSAEEMAWLEENRLLPIAEYARRFNQAFDRDIATVNLHALRKRRGWKTGRTGQFAKGSVPVNKGKPCPLGTGGRHPNAQRTQFKKGQLPHTAKFLGHERLSKDGYVEISVTETNPYTGYERRYVHKHRWLWEEAHGPVPDGMVLKCLGEKSNPDPSNWELMSRSMLPRLNGGRFKRRISYDEAPADLKPTVMAVAKLEQRQHELRTKSE